LVHRTPHDQVAETKRETAARRARGGPRVAAEEVVQGGFFHLFDIRQNNFRSTAKNPANGKKPGQRQKTRPTATFKFIYVYSKKNLVGTITQHNTSHTFTTNSHYRHRHVDDANVEEDE
jgi:hypothetical protein